MRCLVLVVALLLGGPAWAAPEAGGAAFGVANRGGAVLRVAQSSLVAIDAPKRIDTDQETVDFTGRAMAPGEVTLSVNGTPVTLASDGTFRIRRQVPVGRSKLVLVVEGSYGDRVEHKIFVRRTAVAAGSTDYGRFHALVIGNNNYRYLTDLKMAVSDAQAVAAMLIEVYGFNVETLIDATRSDIVSALARKRAQLTEKDNLLIYYAGHGSLDVGSDEGYWLPVDAEPDNPVNWVSNNMITGQLRAMRAKHVMVVADSCYSGKLTRGAVAQLKTGAERTAWLERMAAKRSRTALTSGGLEPVLDAGGGEYSVFAKAFLETLRDNTRILDGQSLFDAIKRPIVVNADQTPEYADVRKAGHDGGDFIFVPLVINLAVNVETSQPASAAVETGRSGDAAATLEQETVFWQSVKDSKDPASFEVYLSEYPNGKFAALARLKLKQLGGETQTAAVVPPPVSAIAIDEMDATFVALKTANLRAGPTTAAERVGRLERDAAVAVTGKLADGNWYRVEQAGRTAFVFGSLVAEVDPAEIAAWQSIAGSSDDSDFEAFLGGFPSGHFAPRARAKRTALAALAPPEAAPAPAPEAAPTTTDLDIAFWESVKDSTRPADFEAYLRRFPDGHFADLALIRLKAIRGAELREAVRLEAERQAAAKAEAERLAAAQAETERQAAEAEAERQAAAAAEVQTALATPPPKAAVAIDKEKLVADKALRKAMKDHYKKAGIYKREGGAAGGTSQALIESFGKIEVTRVAGDIVTLNVSFRWSLDGSQKSGSARGVYTVRVEGSTYRVLNLKTGGKSY